MPMRTAFWIGTKFIPNQSSKGGATGAPFLLPAASSDFDVDPASVKDLHDPHPEQDKSKRECE